MSALVKGVAPLKPRAARKHGKNLYGIYDDDNHLIGTIAKRSFDLWCASYDGEQQWVNGTMGRAIGNVFARHRTKLGTATPSKPRAATYGDVGAEPEIDSQEQEEAIV